MAKQKRFVLSLLVILVQTACLVVRVLKLDGV
uniref:Uncharacterized protein n=1 Tax=Coprothermobacter proteolyticus (strain ATCC 35245 / DSM 5265 / OCM 4 / BT) TaxID=309798 RepID=B5Y760_COPPD